MKNKESWKPAHIRTNKDGKFIGSHMERIVGSSYEPVIRRHAKGLLADVGCGSVPFYDFYRDLITDNICMDWGREDGEVSYLDHTVDLNLEKIPLETNSVDTVLCTDVLEHIRKPEELFSEMARILKPNGNLILTLPFISIWMKLGEFLQKRQTIKRISARSKELFPLGYILVAQK